MQLNRFAKRLAFTGFLSLVTPVLLAAGLLAFHVLIGGLDDYFRSNIETYVVSAYVIISFLPFFLFGNAFPSSSECDGCLASTFGFVLAIVSTWLYYFALINLGLFVLGRLRNRY